MIIMGAEEQAKLLKSGRASSMAIIISIPALERLIWVAQLAIWAHFMLPLCHANAIVCTFLFGFSMIIFLPANNHGPLSARQRNAMRMAFHLWSDRGPFQALTVMGPGLFSQAELHARKLTEM